MSNSVEQTVINSYKQEAGVINSNLTQLTKKSNYLSMLRLINFLAILFCIFLLGPRSVSLAAFSAIALLVTFIYLVLAYDRLQKQIAYENNLKAVVQNEIGHFSYDKNSYDNGLAYADASHPYTDDLDIFGEASLYNFLNRCVTNNGKNMLADWLKNYESAEISEQRQEAIKELKRNFKETLWFRANLYPLKDNLLDDIVVRLQKNTSLVFDFLNKGWLKIYIRLVPLISILIIAICAFSLISWTWFFLFAFLNFIVTGFYLKRVNLIHSFFTKSASQLNTYAALLQWIEEHKWESDLLKKETLNCKDPLNKEPAYRQAANLARLIQQMDSRLNIYVSPFLQALFLWDLRYSLKLQEWFDKSAPTVIESCLLIGKFEALISLATLHHNHPGWVFPEFKDGFVLEATELGHPLISPESRVYNDYSVLNNKTTDVITGSNMAGKSTFLRSIGINLVLAYAGAPVCCNNFRVSLIRLISYMRIRDSLHENTSTFKAELNRLKMILDLTSVYDNSFALIDEMLRGTNSRDKYFGTKAFIKKLIAQNSAAIIATHDLQVAELEKEYPGFVRNFHFDIQTNDNEMFFDYKLKTGECRSFNASALLKQIGLDF